MIRPLLALAALLAPAVASAAPPPRPKLIVMIAVDQFSAELWERYRGSFTGGLKRLDDGVTFARGYQSHSGTETCPGHSTMLTGRHPAGTGIVARPARASIASPSPASPMRRHAGRRTCAPKLWVIG
jgi:arylsulfatase A-like enzyme